MIAVTLLWAACSGDVPAGPPPGNRPNPLSHPNVATRITLHPPFASLIAVGDTISLMAIVSNAAGQRIESPNINWASTDSTIASVSSGGLVTGVGRGAARIMAVVGTAWAAANVDVSDSVAADRAALVALFEATGGEDWNRNEGWLSRAPLSAWYGITTNREGRVWFIELGDNDLAGELPPLLGNLTHLASLNMWENSLSGRIPAEWADLRSLRVLLLGGNELSGQIPGELGDIVSLERIELYTNALSGPIPAALSRLPRLAELRLGKNQLTGDLPAAFGDLRNLERLDLSSNALSGTIPASWGRLASLETLDLTRTGVHGPIPAELGRLSALKFLSLSRTDLSGRLPPELGNLERLERLDVSSTKLSGLIPRSFLDLSRLELFRHDGTDLCTPLDAAVRRWLEGLRRYEGRECEPTAVERFALEDLHNGTGGESWIRSDGWKQSRPVGEWYGVRAGADGRVLDLALRGNGLEGELPGVLGNLTKLEGFDAGDNGLEGDLGWLSGAAGLREIRLDHNEELAGVLPLNLTSLADLSVLHFHGTGLCASPGPTFRAFWDGIADRSGPVCENVGEVRLSLPAVYLIQATQNQRGRVPLVGGRDALLRVFLTGDRPGAFYEPRVVAEFRRGGEVVHRMDVPRGDMDRDQLTTRMDESRLEASFNAMVPGSVLAEGTELVVEVDPEGAVPRASGSQDRFPATGSLPLDIVELPEMQLTLVPVAEARDPDWSTREWTDGVTADSPQMAFLRTVFPVNDLSVRTADPYLTSLDLSSPDGQWALLNELVALREMENGTGYYYGAARSKFGNVRGIANLDGWVAMGKPLDHELTHEVGHNMNLMHAPCGGALRTDQRFPHRGGQTGAWGYDFRNHHLVSPREATDIMGYCWHRTPWISDYHFTRATHERRRREVAAETASAGAAAPADVLVLWGGVLGGQLRLEPAFRVRARPRLAAGSGGPYRLEAISVDGAVRFSFGFVPKEDYRGSRSFYFALPIEADWADSIERIRLTGPEGSVVLGTGDEQSISVVRDRTTGRLRAILRNWDGQLPAVLQDAPNLEFRHTRTLGDALRLDGQP